MVNCDLKEFCLIQQALKNREKERKAAHGSPLLNQARGRLPPRMGPRHTKAGGHSLPWHWLPPAVSVERAMPPRQRSLSQLPDSDTPPGQWLATLFLMFGEA